MRCAWAGRKRLRTEADPSDDEDSVAEDETGADESADSSESTMSAEAPLSGRLFLDVGAFNKSPWKSLLWMTAYLLVTSFGRVVIAYAALRDEYIKYRDGPDPKGIFMFKLVDWYANQWVLWGFGFVWLTNVAMAPQVGSVLRVFGILPIMGASMCYPVEETFDINLGRGFHSLYFIGWLLVWSALLLFRPGCRPGNLVFVLLCVVFLTFFFAGIDLYVPIYNSVPPFFRGLVCATFLSVMKIGLAWSVKLFMAHWWTTGTNYALVVCLAGLVVALSHTLKCLACIKSARRAKTVDGAMWAVLRVCTSNLVCEVVERNDVVHSLCYYVGLLKWKPRPIFNDLRMQCYFSTSYCYVVPLVPSVLVLLIRQPGLFDINGASDHLVVSGAFWVALFMFLLFNGLSDLITLLLQRRPGEGLAATVRRLQHCGEHRPLFKRPPSATYFPEVLKPPQNEVVEPVDVVFFGFRIPSYLVLQVLIISVSVDCWESGWEEMISKSEQPVRPPISSCTAFL